MLEENLRSGGRKRHYKGTAVAVADGMARHRSHTRKEPSGGYSTGSWSVNAAHWKEQKCPIMSLFLWAIYFHGFILYLPHCGWHISQHCATGGFSGVSDFQLIPRYPTSRSWHVLGHGHKLITTSAEPVPVPRPAWGSQWPPARSPCALGLHSCWHS